MVTAAEMMTQGFVQVDGGENVSAAIGKMRQQGAAYACIPGDPVKVLSPHALLRARIDIQAKAETFAIPVPQLSPDDDLLAVVSAMYDTNVGLLPVVDRGKLIGAISAREALERLRESPEFGRMKVADVRHPQPIVVGVDESIDTALSIMRDERIHHLPVVGDDGRIEGMLSVKDALDNYYSRDPAAAAHDRRQRPVSRTRAFEADRPDLPSLPVSNIMGRGEIATVGEHQEVREAISRMLDRGVLSLIILEDRIPQAIITKKDIFEAAIHARTEQREGIQYVGLDDLDIDPFEKEHVRRLVSRNSDKLERYVHNENQLTVHIKEYAREGRRHKFSVHLRLTYPGSTVPACQADAWNLRTAVQDAFSRLTTQLERQYKGNHKETISIRKTGREVPT